MKYKQILLILMVIAFTKLNAQKNTENQTEKNLIGTWTASVSKITTEKKGTLTTEEILCNVCPKIIFTFKQKMQNATVIKPNGDKENYFWTIKGNTMKLYNIDAVANLKPFFISGYKYEFKLDKKKGLSELELFKQNNKSSIILRK
jgi:hypothetical protein